MGPSGSVSLVCATSGPASTAHVPPQRFDDRTRRSLPGAASASSDGCPLDPLLGRLRRPAGAGRSGAAEGWRREWPGTRDRPGPAGPFGRHPARRGGPHHRYDDGATRSPRRRPRSRPRAKAPPQIPHPDLGRTRGEVHASAQLLDRERSARKREALLPTGSRPRARQRREIADGGPPARSGQGPHWPAGAPPGS